MEEIKGPHAREVFVVLVWVGNLFLVKIRFGNHVYRPLTSLIIVTINGEYLLYHPGPLPSNSSKDTMILAV